MVKLPHHKLAPRQIIPHCWLSMVKLTHQQSRVKHLQTFKVPNHLTFLIGSTTSLFELTSHSREMSKRTCRRHKAHNLHSGSANYIFRNVCLENCHNDLQRGQDVVVSQNKSDQEILFADPKWRFMLEDNNHQMTPWSLWDILVIIELTYYAYSDGRLSQQLPTCLPFHCTFDPSWSCIKRN